MLYLVLKALPLSSWLRVSQRYNHNPYCCGGFPGDSVVKNLPSMQGMQFQSLGQEDSLEEETAAHFSILAWEIP